MKTMARPLLDQPAHQLRQLLDALRRQHRGRLVEDQHAAAAQQRLDDLDLLLLAERELAGDLVEIDRDADLARSRRACVVSSAPVWRPPPGHAEHQVLQHGQGRHQHDVLEDRADAAGQGLARRGRCDLAAVRRGCGRRRARCMPDSMCDQRRLAGAVLAQQRMDLARAKRQIDPSFATTPGNALVIPAGARQRRPAARRRSWSLRLGADVVRSIRVRPARRGAGRAPLRGQARLLVTQPLLSLRSRRVTSSKPASA